MEEGNKKIAVAGHISLDITPVFQNSGKQKLSELFQPGKLLKVGKAMMCTGGAVSNTGLGLKRLGADVVLMAKIGDDYFGNALKDMISAHGCETCISQVPGENTSYTIVLAPKGLDRFFLHDPGCNDTFGCGDVDFEKVGEASHFHFGYPPIMRMFYLDEGEELVRLFKKVKSMGLTTSLDLVAVDPDSEAAGMDWARILERVLPYVDFFVPSIEELGYMLDRPLYCKWQEKAGGEDVTGILSLDEGEELVRLFKKVKAMGLTTSLDLVAVDPDSEAAGMDWARILERVLPYVDFFVPSIEELGYMLDRPLYCKWQEKAGGEDVTGILSLEEDVKPLAARALSMGTRCVLLKCGAAGMYLKTAPEPVWREFLPGFTGWNDISHFEDSYVPDCILSGTGAGDTSIAAFIKAMLDGCGPLECVRLAAATGASCVTAYDALSGLLSFEELRQKMEAGWEKQNIIHP